MIAHNPCNDKKARKGNHGRHNGKTIKTIGEIHRIGAPHHHTQCREWQSQHAPVNGEIFEKRNRPRHANRGIRMMRKPKQCAPRQKPFPSQAGASSQTSRTAMTQFENIIPAANQGKSHHDHKGCLNVGIENIRPQKQTHRHREQNQQSAHRGRSLLGLQMSDGAIHANGLSCFLMLLQKTNDSAAQHQSQQ